MGLFRVMFNGNTPAPGEVWSVGTSWIGPNTSIPFQDLLDWATGIGTAIAAASGNTVINYLSSSGSITQIRVEQRDETDESLMQAAEFTLPTPKVGAGTPTKVLQASVVISLLTIQPGRSFRGRCYWPAWSYTQTAGMRFNAGDQAALLTSFANIVGIVKAQAVVVDPAYQMQLGVRSKLLHSTAQVINIACGDVPDTQRRRRDALTEVYVQQVLPP